MTQINLIKRQTITIDEFRSWLNQLITDKKGALPDLNDWKVIKEQLDKVGKTVDTNGPGYSILESPGVSVTEYSRDVFAPDCEYDPYDFQYTMDYLDKLCEESDDYRYDDGLINQFYDEYIRTRIKEYENGTTKTESDYGCYGCGYHT